MEEINKLVALYKNIIAIKDDSIRVLTDHLTTQDAIIAALDEQLKKLQEDNAHLTRDLEKFKTIEDTVIAQQDALFATAVFPNVV